MKLPLVVDCYHVTNVPDTLPQPTWSALRKSMARIERYDGPLLGVEFVSTNITRWRGGLPTYSMYPLEQQGSRHHRVRTSVDLGQYTLYFVRAIDKQVTIVAVQPDDKAMLAFASTLGLQKLTPPDYGGYIPDGRPNDYALDKRFVNVLFRHEVDLGSGDVVWDSVGYRPSRVRAPRPLAPPVDPLTRAEELLAVHRADPFYDQVQLANGTAAVEAAIKQRGVYNVDAFTPEPSSAPRPSDVLAPSEAANLMPVAFVAPVADARSTMHSDEKVEVRVQRGKEKSGEEAAEGGKAREYLLGGVGGGGQIGIEKGASFCSGAAGSGGDGGDRGDGGDDKAGGNKGAKDVRRLCGLFPTIDKKAVEVIVKGVGGDLLEAVATLQNLTKTADELQRGGRFVRESTHGAGRGAPLEGEIAEELSDDDSQASSDASSVPLIDVKTALEACDDDGGSWKVTVEKVTIEKRCGGAR